MLNIKHEKNLWKWIQFHIGNDCVYELLFNLLIRCLNIHIIYYFHIYV